MADIFQNPLLQFINQQDALLANSPGAGTSALPAAPAPSQPGLANLRPQASIPVDPLQVNPTGAGNPMKTAQLLILAATKPEEFAAMMDEAGVPAPASLEEITGGATQPGLSNIRPQANVPSDPLQVNPTGVQPAAPSAPAPAPSVPAFAQNFSPTQGGPVIGASASPEGLESQKISDFFQSIVGGSGTGDGVQFASTTDPGSDLFVPPAAAAPAVAAPAPAAPPLGLPQDIVPQGFGAAETAAAPATNPQALAKVLSGIRAPGSGGGASRPPSAGVIAPRAVNSGLLELLFQPLPQAGR